MTAAPTNPVHILPGPDPWQAIVITYPAPNNHTHTCQQRWEDIHWDLLPEHLGLTRTDHTLQPVRGVGEPPHGIHTPGLWAYATPINPQAAEKVGNCTIHQASPDPDPALPHPARLHHFVGISRPRHPHPPTSRPPPRHQHHRPPPGRTSGSHPGRGPGNLEPAIPG